MSSCQNVSHVGLSSLTSGTGCLRQLTLAYGSPVSPLTPLPLNTWGYPLFRFAFKLGAHFSLNGGSGHSCSC